MLVSINNIIKIKVFLITSIFMISCADKISTYGDAINELNNSQFEKDENNIEKTKYSVKDLPLNYRPERDKDGVVDELGLWMTVEKMEKSLKTSDKILKDKKLNDYVNKVFCNVSAEYCKEIRIYIVKYPYFNASMYPNGMMNIYTGALLRISNEAQLAGLLGHELTHYLRRHSYKRMESAVKIRGAKVIGNLLFGNTFGLAALALDLNMAAYNRNDERECDGYGMALMARAGYDPIEVSNLWKTITKTSPKRSSGQIISYMASHPSVKEREKVLRNLSYALPYEGNKIGLEEYKRNIEPYINSFIQDEISYGKFEDSLALFDKLINDDFFTPHALFGKGEKYRTAEKQKDLDKALVNLKLAEKYEDNSVISLYKSMGLLYMNLGNKQEARRYFSKYVETQKSASDLDFIKSYMEQL